MFLVPCSISSFLVYVASCQSPRACWFFLFLDGFGFSLSDTALVFPFPCPFLLGCVLSAFGS